MLGLLLLQADFSDEGLIYLNENLENLAKSKKQNKLNRTSIIISIIATIISCITGSWTFIENYREIIRIDAEVPYSCIASFHNSDFQDLVNSNFQSIKHGQNVWIYMPIKISVYNLSRNSAIIKGYEFYQEPQHPLSWHTKQDKVFNFSLPSNDIVAYTFYVNYCMDDELGEFIDQYVKNYFEENTIDHEILEAITNSSTGQIENTYISFLFDRAIKEYCNENKTSISIYFSTETAKEKKISEIVIYSSEVY